MVRLMLTLTPIVCVFSAIAFSRVFELFLNEQDNEINVATNQSNNEQNSVDKRLYDKPNKANKKVI